MFKYVKFKKAFTLAETLITLAIIGVVASLTIPTVIKNYQKHQTEVRLKKVYLTLNEAFNMAQVEYGDKKSWDFTKHADDGYDYGSGNIYFANKYLFPFLKGKKNYEYNEVASGSAMYSSSYPFVTADGVGIKVFNGADQVIIHFDINGKKEPNKIGKDIFITIYSKDKGFISTYGGWRITLIDYIKHYGREKAIESCINGSGSGTITYCLDLIMLNNWKIPDDYPW